MLVANKFKENNLPVLLTREPGGTELGEKIRDIALTDPDIDLDTKAMLINAVRIEHTKKVIIPALEKGINVICDRYTASTTAYQTAQGWPKKLIKQLNKFCGIKPDFIFFLMISVADSKLREQDGHDFCKNEEYLQKVLDAYGSIDRIYWLDAMARRDSNVDYVWEVINGRE
jgi:dTMP kinase